MKGRTELERREQYISILHDKFGKTHPLVALIKSCLVYEPEKRPTASQSLEGLGRMRAAVRDPYSGLNRLQLERSLAEKETEVEQIPQLRSQLEQFTVSEPASVLGGGKEKGVGSKSEEGEEKWSISEGGRKRMRKRG